MFDMFADYFDPAYGICENERESPGEVEVAMAGSSVSWRQSVSRQYKSDPDLRTAIHFSAGSVVVGVGCSLCWSLLSRSFFAVFAVNLLSSVFIARRVTLNPSIAIQAAFIGFVFGCSLTTSALAETDGTWLFSLYVFVLCIFHFTEFFFTAITNRRGLQADSFLLNHSVAYWAAAFFGWTEFVLEQYFTPFMKVTWIGGMGLCLCFCGELLRKTGMLHAGSAFTHRLALTKRPDHRLCTSGVYAWVRHPGYLGWFLWSIGTQIVLCNPLSAVAYCLASWKFFNERIFDEEYDLIKFFGAQYLQYQSRVWIGIPFVSGYHPSIAN